MPLLDAFGRPIEAGRTPRGLAAHKSKIPRIKPMKRQRRVPSTQGQGLQDHRPTTLDLRAQHMLGGQHYGPGRVTVTAKLARALRHAEDVAAQHDARFAGTRACVVGPGRARGALSVTQVAPEFFDASYLAVLPFGVVDRTTATFQPT